MDGEVTSREGVGKFTFLTLRCEQGGEGRREEDIETTGETTEQRKDEEERGRTEGREDSRDTRDDRADQKMNRGGSRRERGQIL